ncbi:MAG: DUF1775 domain-containing protein [Gemmatimonadales bacterium]
MIIHRSMRSLVDYPVLILVTAALHAAVAVTLDAQVSIRPTVTTPAEWERFSVGVINTSDTATVSVRIVIPSAITVLGVDAPSGWEFQLEEAGNGSAQAIVWSGGELNRGEFRQFEFMGRIKADARKKDLVLPVTLDRAAGADLEWAEHPGSYRRALRVAIVGRTSVSAGGAVALAGAALGLAALAIALTLSKKSR